MGCRTAKRSRRSASTPAGSTPAAACRGVLTAADEPLAAELRGVLASAEAYASAAKPRIDWDDQAARAALVDARAHDAHAVLGVLAGRPLTQAVAHAAPV